MSKNKGSAALYALGFLIVIIVIVIIVIKSLTAINISSVKVNLDISIKSDDTGTWVLSFLRTNNNGNSHIQSLGSVYAENYMENIETDIGSIKNTLEKSWRIERFSRSVSILGKIKIGDTTQDERSLIDIPLPGGTKTALEIKG